MTCILYVTEVGLNNTRAIGVVDDKGERYLF